MGEGWLSPLSSRLQLDYRTVAHHQWECPPYSDGYPRSTLKSSCLYVSRSSLAAARSARLADWINLQVIEDQPVTIPGANGEMEEIVRYSLSPCNGTAAEASERGRG